MLKSTRRRHERDEALAQLFGRPAPSLGHNQGPPLTPNPNAIAYSQGKRFRLEVTAAGNGGRVCGEFAVTRAEANRRKRALWEAGYVATLFAISETGGLSFV